MSEGATCKNWTWSWSFIDGIKKRIIFGAWEDLKLDDGKKVLILSDDWERNKAGHLKSGFSQSIEHINKIIHDGYSLYTFSQVRKDTTDERVAASIKSFEPKLYRKYLERIGDGWYATDTEVFKFTDDVDLKYFEGDATLKLMTRYERNPEARAKCIEFHKPICKVCDFNFYKVYGEHGKNYIQVHHLNPISKIKKRYKIDPIKDLVPLCANCHVMIHIGSKMLTIEELKKKIKVKKK
jgi:5-methylcytosine-specific restriction protein A